MKARRVVVESFFIPVATAHGSVPRTGELNEIWVASKSSPQPSPEGRGSKTALGNRRRVESLELRIAVKQCEVRILAGPNRISVTRIPRLLDRDQRVAGIVHRAED